MRAPGITPAASVLPRLVVLFARAVTSLDQFLYVQGSRPGIVSARITPSDFWEQNLEALPYPPGKVFLTLFGTVSACTYRQGPYAPFMVELFAVGPFGRTPSLVIGPAARVAACRLPTAAQVERTEGILRSEPPGGISRHCRHHPLQVPRPGQSPVCLGRPYSAKAWDRSCRLTLGELYLQQPPSNWTSVSRRIQLYVPPTWRLMRPPP
jgi:hypothetical protein